MWVLAPQALEALDDALDTALTYANGAAIYGLSDAERAAIHAVYQLYDAMLGQPDAGLRPGALDVARPYLAAAYDQVQIGGRLASLRARLLASTAACPYSRFGEPRDPDPPLPRSGPGEPPTYPNHPPPTSTP